MTEEFEKILAKIKHEKPTKPVDYEVKLAIVPKKKNDRGFDYFNLIVGVINIGKKTIKNVKCSLKISSDSIGEIFNQRQLDSYQLPSSSASKYKIACNSNAGNYDDDCNVIKNDTVSKVIHKFSENINPIDYESFNFYIIPKAETKKLQLAWKINAEDYLPELTEIEVDLE
jgi:hypothetical protein